MGSVFSFFSAAWNLFGLFQDPVYDAIVVGYVQNVAQCASDQWAHNAAHNKSFHRAGAAGSVLAQTLSEDTGLNVLLLERGGERVESSRHQFGIGEALHSRCAEVFRVEGVTIATGNCMGGATAINHGVFIQETPGWLQDVFPGMGTDDEIATAYDWVRERVAPDPQEETPGSPASVFVETMIDSLSGGTANFGIVNVDPGQPQVPEFGIWRTHSIFEPTTRRRRSADTVLDRDNPNLDIRVNSNVERILFDGDLGVPIGAATTSGDTPRARCVRLSTFEVICVKAEGRIYLAAGALRTPDLLMKSGIGKDGRKVTNAEVRRLRCVDCFCTGL